MRNFARDCYPLVGIDAKGSYRVNFGAAKFQFNLRSHFAWNLNLSLNSAFAQPTHDGLLKKRAEVQNKAWCLIKIFALRAALMVRERELVQEEVPPPPAPPG